MDFSLIFTGEGKGRRRAPAMLPKEERLSASQLTDLLNYVLGRPKKLPYAEAISVCVVASWREKNKRERVQAWCEARLIECSFAPRRKSHFPSKLAPREIWGFIFQQGERI